MKSLNIQWHKKKSEKNENNPYSLCYRHFREKFITINYVFKDNYINLKDTEI